MTEPLISTQEWTNNLLGKAEEKEDSAAFPDKDRKKKGGQKG